MLNQPIVARGAPPLLWIMAAIFCGFELVFGLSAAGLLPGPDWRTAVYLHAAFFDLWFDELMDGGEVPPWFWSSWITHAFLHGGALHLAMNTAVFLALGGYIARGLGTARFLVLFVVTAIAGALLYGLLATSNAPMVGASGALFGFIGALKFWEWRYIRMTGATANRFWGTIIALIVINGLLAFSMPGGGSLAWEAHLGGFLAGFAIAPLLAPQAAGPSPI